MKLSYRWNIVYEKDSQVKQSYKQSIVYELDVQAAHPLPYHSAVFLFSFSFSTFFRIFVAYLFIELISILMPFHSSQNPHSRTLALCMAHYLALISWLAVCCMPLIGYLVETLPRVAQCTHSHRHIHRHLLILIIIEHLRSVVGTQMVHYTCCGVIWIYVLPPGWEEFPERQFPASALARSFSYSPFVFLFSLPSSSWMQNTQEYFHRLLIKKCLKCVCAHQEREDEQQVSYSDI